MKLIIIILSIVLIVISFIIGLRIHMTNYFNKKLDDMNKGDFK